MKRQLLPLKLGCIVSAIFLIVFLYNFPSSHDSFLYVILWIAGLFSLPAILGLFFGFGSMLGNTINSFFNLFKPKSEKESDEYVDYEDVTDSPEYNNTDKYNLPDNNKDSEETKQLE